MVFGVLEQAQGKASTEAAERTFRQDAVDVVYRFYRNEKLFVGARYNKAGGDLVGIEKAGAKRVQLAGGWFITPAPVSCEIAFGTPDADRCENDHPRTSEEE